MQTAPNQPAAMATLINTIQSPAHLQEAFHATIHKFMIANDAHRRSLSNPIMPCEFYDGGESFSHVCYNFATSVSVDPALPGLTPVQGCFTDNITDPANTRVSGECSSLCVMTSRTVGADNTSICSHCAYLENGQFVYDCTNLFPNAACAASDSGGNCVKEYEQWTCAHSKVFGRGWECTMYNQPNPAFLHEEISQNDITTSLVCSNDVSGLDATACQDPVCFIGNVSALVDNIDGQCDSCRVAHQEMINETRPLFEYDCIQSFPDLKCPIMLPNGTCRHEPLVPPLVPENTTLWNIPSFILEEEQNAAEMDVGWVLNVDPTIFNALMDVFDRIAMTLFAASVGMLYPVYLGLQLRGGKRGVQAAALGHVPSDFWSAIQSMRSWNFSIAGVLLLLLVFVADFAHSVADFDLEFVSIEQKGPNRTVLELGAEPHQRNPFPVIELAGDPINTRTVVYNKNIVEGKLEASRAETSVLNEFLRAINFAARGGSPFVKMNRTSWRMVDTSYGNVDEDFLSFYVDNDASALVEMDMEIPLECYDVEMSKSERVSVKLGAYVEPRETTSWVPNCILKASRASRIYGGQRMESPRILETLEIIAPIFNGGASKHIRLTKGNESFVSFEASPRSKALARDRNATEDDVRGRRFYDVDGLEIGTVSISFANVFMASGAPQRDSVDGQKRTEYGLVAEVDGTCPGRPSGLNKGDEECLVTIVLECDTFPEDSAVIVHDVYGPELESSACDFQWFNIAWGRNFMADADLAAKVAGLYGMTRPTISESTLRTFYQQSILAALFALGQVREAPSIKEVVRPRVNIQYIVFMLFPFVLSIAMFAVAIWANRHCKLPVIPTEPWQFLLLGAEDGEALPKRQDRQEPFPEVDNELVFAAFLEDDASLPDSSADGEATGSKVDNEASIQFGIVRKNPGESLRNLTLSTRKSPTVIPLGTVQGPQSDKDDSSDDGDMSTSTTSSNGKNLARRANHSGRYINA